jgi:hypothetical protein
MIENTETSGELHRLTDTELLQHVQALSAAVAYNQSNAEQLACGLAQQLHGLAVEHDFLKVCRLLNAYDFAAAQFMLQHLMDRLQMDVPEGGG